jgi:hypothetical protein
MKKIKVDAEGGLYIDDSKKQISELIPELLEEVVELALKDEIDFDLSGGHPIAGFFKTIQEQTKAGAEFRTEIEALSDDVIVAAEDVQHVGSGADNTAYDEDIPF